MRLTTPPHSAAAVLSHQQDRAWLVVGAAADAQRAAARDADANTARPVPEDPSPLGCVTITLFASKWNAPGETSPELSSVIVNVVVPVASNSPVPESAAVSVIAEDELYKTVAPAPMEIDVRRSTRKTSLSVEIVAVVPSGTTTSVAVSSPSPDGQWSM